MRTFAQMHDDCNNAGHPCSYWGDHGHFLVVKGTNRDDDSLGRSNFRSLLRKLGGESDTVVVERENHWACGWVEFILLDPADTQRVELAEEILTGLDDYPVVDESDWSELESEEFWSLAEGELKEFDGWSDVLHEQMEECNTEIGCDSSEWETIEAARELLENPPTNNWELRPKDVPGQLMMF